MKTPLLLLAALLFALSECQKENISWSQKRTGGNQPAQKKKYFDHDELITISDEDSRVVRAFVSYGYHAAAYHLHKWLGNEESARQEKQKMDDCQHIFSDDESASKLAQK